MDIQESPSEHQERLKAMAEAIGIIKSTHYCGTQQAYEYLKERGLYFNFSLRLGRELRKEFPDKRLPTPNDVNDISLTLSSFISGTLREKLPGDLFEKLSKIPLIAKQQRRWLDENHFNFLLQYYRRLYSSGSHEVSNKVSAFLETAKEFDDGLFRYSASRLPGRGYWQFAGRSPREMESDRVNKHFMLVQIFDRMERDHVLNNDEYQRQLIATYVESEIPNIDGSLDDPLTALEKPLHEDEDDCDAVYGEIPSETHDPLNNYLRLIMRRHSSFVKKLLAEYMAEDGQCTNSE